MELVNKQKVEALFSPALTGKTTYTADEILLALQTTPTVDAIPIEWLKNELIPKAENLGATEYANNIRFVLEDWEAWKKYRG